MRINLKYQHPVSMVVIPQGSTIVTLAGEIIAEMAYIIMPIKIICTEYGTISQRLGKCSIHRDISEWKSLFEKEKSIISITYPTKFTI
jgi:hypothetical protein